MSYSLLGDGAATSFFKIDAESGSVKIAADLKTDDSVKYFLRIQASDSGTPACSSVTVAEVNVNRNLYSPQFLASEYRGEIMETHLLSDVIVTLEAEDRDDRVRSSCDLFRISTWV